MEDDVDDAVAPIGAAEQPRPSEAPPLKGGTRDWLADLNARRKRDDADRQQALDDALAAGTLVTLSDEHIPRVEEGGVLPVVDIMLGATRIGLLILEDCTHRRIVITRIGRS